MQTITTKYLGPTNHRGSRVKATHTGDYTSVTLSYDYALNSEGNHIAAAKSLADKLNWQGDYIGGHTAEGMVFVNADSACAFTATRKEELAA
jgi:hypothetical protein